MKCGVVLACVMALLGVHASPFTSKRGTHSQANGEHKFSREHRPGGQGHHIAGGLRSAGPQHKIAKAHRPGATENMLVQASPEPQRESTGHDAHKASKHDVDQRQVEVVTSCPGPDSELLLAPVTISNLGLYDNNQDCAWHVVVPAGTFINVVFHSFSIEYHSTCSYDRLAIYDAENESGPLREVLCGSTTPSEFQSITNHLLFRFTTDYSVTSGGFEIILTQTSIQGSLTSGVDDSLLACPGPRHVTGQQQLTIMSPGLAAQQSYTNNLQCRWMITVAEGRYVRLEVLFIDIEAACGCWFDQVQVRDGLAPDSPIMEAFCGSDIPPPLTSSSNSLQVAFLTDCSVTGAGFILNVTETATAPPVPEDHPACPGTASVSAQGGEIVSMGFGNAGYGNREVCAWSVSAEPGQFIRLTFVSFDVEDHDTCSYDRLTIYDGGNDMEPSVTYCGSQLPPTFTSVGDHVMLVFITDASVTAAGFRITTSLATDAGEVLPDNPILSSPGPQHLLLSTGAAPTSIYSPFFLTSGYRNDEFSSWLVQAPEATFLSVHFVSMDIENSVNCVWDALTIIDGPATSHTILLQICGTEMPSDFVTLTDTVLITFTSDGSIIGRGFEIQLSVETESGHLVNFEPPQLACSGPPLVVSADSGRLTSPNFGVEPYANRAYCQWLLQTGEGRTFELTFSNFSVEAQSSCYYDSLTIYNGPLLTSPLVGTFCGDALPPAVQSSGSSLLLVFETDCSVSDLGFSIEYRTEAAAVKAVEEDVAARREENEVKDILEEIEKILEISLHEE